MQIILRASNNKLATMLKSKVIMLAEQSQDSVKLFYISYTAFQRDGEWDLLGIKLSKKINYLLINSRNQQTTS